MLSRFLRFTNHKKFVQIDFKLASQYVKPNKIPRQKAQLLKPFVFTCTVGITSFAGCAILQYELSKQRIQSETLWDKFKYKRSNKAFSLRRTINEWWNNLNEGRKVAAAIVAMNMAVFIGWRIPTMRNFMMRWFLCSLGNRRVSTLLLSTFSHSELWHFGANMFVFWSFAPLIQSILGTEQFIAFYLTGGTVASLVSHFVKASRGINVPSLGASGALLAVLAACCIASPDSQLSILFLPFFTFSAGSALYGVIAFDVAGIVLRWSVFDHAAHLGGTLFGCWYILYGKNIFWPKRDYLQRWWHEQRNSK